MSQVIVTHDRYSALREKSRQQEARIEREGSFQGWQRSNITKRGPLMFVWSIVFKPVVLLWYFLGVIISAAMLLARSVFKVLGQVVGGDKNLK